jgi:hypothetical protein
MLKKHAFAALIAIGALLLAVTPAAFAAPATPKPSVAEGTPTIDDSRPMGYYIFHNDDGFHLRTHGPGAEHVFDAVLRTKGTFENVDVVKLEGDDHVDVLDGGHKLAIHFHTFNFTDGVNFTVRGGERVRFNLKVDDEHIATSNIFLGAKGVHPKHNPFSIRL